MYFLLIHHSTPIYIYNIITQQIFTQLLKSYLNNNILENYIVFSCSKLVMPATEHLVEVVD